MEPIPISESPPLLHADHTQEEDDADEAEAASAEGSPDCSDGEDESCSEEVPDSDGDEVALTPSPGVTDPIQRERDTHRKRRELTDIAAAACARAYNPHQHCGLDEGTRMTKHWDKKRISWKASCHSGSLVDMLNDCMTSYCIWFEEQNWHSKELEGKDINSVEERLVRAVQCLVDKKKDHTGTTQASPQPTIAFRWIGDTGTWTHRGKGVARIWHLHKRRDASKPAWVAQTIHILSRCRLWCLRTQG